MIYEASQFVFTPPPEVARARRVLIKPSAAYQLFHPITTSRETLEAIVRGIRQVSEADIVLIEGPSISQSAQAVFAYLGYDFPRVLTMDVADCLAVEVENPLPKSHALSSLWVPNILLSCDYLISVASFRVIGAAASFSIMNLIGLLPPSRYGGEGRLLRQSLEQLGLDRVAADLYFTLPFDLGVIDGRCRFVSEGDATQGEVSKLGKIFVGEPYKVDREAAQVAGVEPTYLSLIEAARATLQSSV